MIVQEEVVMFLFQCKIRVVQLRIAGKEMFLNYSGSAGFNASVSPARQQE